MSEKEKLDDPAEINYADRKRVKTGQDSAVITVVPTLSDCFLQEEEESQEYNSEEIFSLFEDVGKQLNVSLDSVLKVKTVKEDDENEANMSFDTADIALLIMEMRKLNRLDKHCAKRNRNLMIKNQQKLDKLNFEFQNLQHEKFYMEKEIQKCLESGSNIEEIDLAPIEEFYRNGVQDEMLENDEDQLKIMRLRWELKQSQKLLDDLNDAEINREGYKKNIKKLKENLADARPVLNAILEITSRACQDDLALSFDAIQCLEQHWNMLVLVIDCYNGYNRNTVAEGSQFVSKATEPMQAKLGTPLQLHHSRHKAAKFLPIPMYCLYCQISSYNEVYDQNVKVSIRGNVAQAKSLLLKLDELEESEEEPHVEEEKEGEEDVKKTPVQVKRHVSVAPVKKEEEIFAKHPLSIHLIIVDKELQLSLEFAYLINLNLVTVRVKSISANLQPSAAVDKILSIDTIFSCLFPDDNGRKSPNPCVVFRLAEINENPFSHDKTGLPYAWAQKIAGLHFMPTCSSERSICKRPFETTTFMQQVIVALKSRLRVRVHLNSQIASIRPSFKVPAELAHFYPHTINSHLKEWSVASWDDFLAYPNKDELLSLNIVNEDAILYKAVIVAGSADLIALVAIPPDYPVTSPVFFLLSLHWETHNINVFDLACKELEKEVNVYCVKSILENKKNNLLICQLHHLCACFDVFVDIAVPKKPFEGPEGFINQIHIAEICRSPGRNRPYQFVPSRKSLYRK